MRLVWREQGQSGQQKAGCCKRLLRYGPGGKGEVRDIVEMVLTETWAAGCRRSGKKRRIQRDNPGFALSKPMGGGAVSWAEEDCE